MTNTEQPDSDLNKNTNTTPAEIITGLIMTAVIFISAGRLNYWQGWLYVALAVLRLIVSHILFAGKSELIQERANPGPGVKTWDKMIYGIYIPLHISVIVTACLDAGRFRWSPALSPAIYLSALAVTIAGHVINMWAMCSNKFFSSLVRIQPERGHTVVEQGPYSIIRHPGNLGSIILQITDSLILGSLWAMIPTLIAVILIVVRTYLEDKTLKAELNGYRDYANKVRFRMIPGIW